MKYSDTYFRKRSGGRRQDKTGGRKYKKGRKERERKYMHLCGEGGAAVLFSVSPGQSLVWGQ